MWGVSIWIDVSTQHNGMRRLHFAAVDVAKCGSSIELRADPNWTEPTMCACTNIFQWNLFVLSQTRTVSRKKPMFRDVSAISKSCDVK